MLSRRIQIYLAVTLATLMSAGTGRAQGAAPFHVQEASIASIHEAMRAGRLTCVQLVQAYLNRIAASDQAGPKLNAIQNINSAALPIAAEMDARARASGMLTGRLHCVPVILKDSINTNFMPTTFGSALFKNFVPPKNATVVERLRAEGAIILAKANMGEYAQGYSGSAFGDCHNAYDPRRSPSGSSCGTGVGIAANFAAIGIGEDTAGSIRGPAAHGSLVGLRPTLQLVSRAGMMPYEPSRDTLGPITRSVADAALVLDIIAGYDPEDPITAWSYGQKPRTYSDFLIANGLAGMRLGILRVPMARDTNIAAPDYKEIQDAITGAARAMAGRGAEIVDPLVIPNLKELVAAAGGGAPETETAINAFLGQFPNAPARSLREIVDSPLVIAKRREELGRDLGQTVTDADIVKSAHDREELRNLVLRVMADNRLDIILYATYDHAPTPVPISTPGTNRVLASALGFPAMAIPGGFFKDGLPIGLEILARPFAEGTLFKAAYDLEQTAKYRRPSPLVPPLPQEP